MSLLAALQCVALHFAPYSALRRALARRLAPPGYLFSERFSGRTALFELASGIRRTSSASVALCPDYICNLVPRSLAEAGWTVEAYRTDERLEVDWDVLALRIGRGDVGLLLGASVFGSSGLLDDLADPGKLDFLRKGRVQVIADLAQDIRLAGALPSQGADVVSAVLSFNNKSFPGVMGGGILAERALTPGGNSLGPRQIVFMYMMWMEIFVRSQTRKSPSDEPQDIFDYSYCKDFPFRLTDNYRPSKLQIICASVGLSKLDAYQARKAEFLQDFAAVETRFKPGAAYVMADDKASRPASRRRKRPYAVEGDPSRSLRPDVAIVHNKGFDDLIVGG